MKFSHHLNLAAAIGAAVLFSCGLQADPVTPPQAAPAWTLKDVNGRPVSFSQFKGKVVVLDFWATWCPPCCAEIPGYVKLQEKYKDQGLVIIGAVYQDSAEAVKKFMVENHMNYPIVMADDAMIEAFGGIDGTPTTFLIDRDGKIRDKTVGAMETDDYEKIIRQYLH